MKVYALASVVAMTGLAAAQANIPTCALSCFQKAIVKTNCGLNTYCQCTTGSKVITNSVVDCLCSSGDCSPSELLQVQKASNQICSAALSASSETYTPPTVPTCSAQGGGAAGGATMSMMSSAPAQTTPAGGASQMSSMASMGSMSSMSMAAGGSGSAAAPMASMSSSASASGSMAQPATGPAATNAPVLGAALGMAGLALLGL